MIRVGWLFCLLITWFYADAQDIEDKENADRIGKIYAKEDFAITRSANSYTFALEKVNGKQQVTALLQASEHYISLKDDVKLTRGVFFDEQSKIDKFHVLTKEGNETGIVPEISDYEHDGIFSSDVRVLTFKDNVWGKGIVKNITYQKKIFDVKYLTSEYFHDVLPVMKKTITFIVPEWLTVEFKEVNFTGYQVVKTVKPDLKKRTTSYEFSIEKLIPLKKEDHAPAVAASYPHIVILCKSYDAKGSHNLISSVDDLYAWYASLISQVNNDPEVIKPLVKKLTEGKSGDEDKIKSIFYWLQENIRYLAFENGIMGYKPETCQQVYSNKYGDCKGMANLAKAMYQLAGYDARLTWLGTNDIPYDYSTPSLIVDNHMICTVLLKDKKYFIDPTESWIAFNDYAHRIQGRQVLIEDGQKYILDHIPAFGIERNKNETFRKLVISGEKISGNIKNVFNGEGKVNILNGYAGVRTDRQEEALKKFLIRQNPNIILKNIVTSDLNAREQPLTISYDIELNNAVTSTSNELYINVELDKDLSSLMLDSSRVNDYELDHKLFVSEHTEFILPSGYKVDYLPKELKRKYENFSFNLTCSQVGNMVVYEKQITIDNAIIRKNDFKDWNSCIKELRKFYNDQIVLVR